MRVLVSAYVCERNAGSEPEIGYSTVLAAAQAGHALTVMTLESHAERLRTDLMGDGAEAEVIGIDPLPGLRRHIGRLGVGHLHYVIWQLAALRVARSIEVKFEVAHHVTFGSDWMPSGLHRLLPTLPVVWGPVGGGAPVAWAMARHLGGARGLAQEAVREAMTRLGRRVTALAVRRDQCLVVAHNDEAAAWYERHGYTVEVRPLVAMPPVPSGASSSVSTDPGLERRLVFIGRLTPWKGCLLAVKVLACLPAGWSLELYGRGAAQTEVGRVATRLGVRERVHLMGHVPKESVWRALETCDALLLPTIHDSAPQPVAQAVRVGCPVVCLDSAGPPTLMRGRGEAVRLGPRLPERLAQAVLKTDRFAPDDRWSADRLPAVIDDLYTRAVARPKAGGRSSASDERLAVPARWKPSDRLQHDQGQSPGND